MDELGEVLFEGINDTPDVIKYFCIGVTRDLGGDAYLLKIHRNGEVIRTYYGANDPRYVLEATSALTTNVRARWSC